MWSPWFTMIYHDVPWFTMICHGNHQLSTWFTMICHDLPWFAMEKPWEKYPHCQICQNRGVTQNHPPPRCSRSPSSWWALELLGMKEIACSKLLALNWLGGKSHASDFHPFLMSSSRTSEGPIDSCRRHRRRSSVHPAMTWAVCV